MQVNIPDNIEKYKVRSVALSKRQIGYLLLAIAVFLLLAILAIVFISNLLLKILAIFFAAVCAAPILAMGFITYMELPLGEVVRRYFQNTNRPFRRERF